jgi:biopolymer transport protein ExbD
MAEIQSNDGGGKKKGGKVKQKKINIFVDFTPMVDMNMLLITFFMLCTSLSKPQTMEIVMPTNKKDVKEEEQSQVKESLAITLLLDKDNKVYYYPGKPDYVNYNSLKDLTYNPKDENSIRSLLLMRNKDVVEKINLLKLEKLNLKISQDTFAARSFRIKNGKQTPVVIIKPTDKATYKNLVDALDEMQICNIGKYVIDSITPGDEFLIKNKETKGVYALGKAN